MSRGVPRFSFSAAILAVLVGACGSLPRVHRQGPASPVSLSCAELLLRSRGYRVDVNAKGSQLSAERSAAIAFRERSGELHFVQDLIEAKLRPGSSASILSIDGMSGTAWRTLDTGVSPQEGGGPREPTAAVVADVETVLARCSAPPNEAL